MLVPNTTPDPTQQPPMDYSQFDTEESKAKQEYDAVVSKLQASMPNIDYDTTFAPYMKQLNAQPITKAPGRAESFARAFGSEESKQDVMSQLKQAHQESSDKQDKILGTERDIMEMKVKQEMAKGESDKALKSTQALKDLEMKLGQVKSRREMAEWEHKNKIEAGNKQKLQEAKLNAADKIARGRIKAAVHAAGGDDKLLIQVMKMYDERDFATLKARLAADPALGLSMTDEEVADMLGTSEGKIQEKIDQAKAVVDRLRPPKGGTTPAVKPSAPTGGPSDKYRKAIQEINAERNQKK